MLIQDLSPEIDAKIRSFNSSHPNTIELANNGVPLHPESIDRLLQTAKANPHAIIAFQPTLDVTSELGLPAYPILAYVYPPEYQQIWSQIKPRIAQFLQIPNFDRLPLLPLNQISKEEQVHYFANHYGAVTPPDSVRVIVGNTCNLQCVMCPYHSPELKPTHTTDFFQGKKFMSWEMMLRIAEDCGQTRSKVLIGSVEEPLLHPQLMDFIALCRSKGVPYIHMTTNGQLLNEEKAQALLEAGLTSIDISIDGATTATYKRVRGSDLAKVEANVNNFIKLRDRLGANCEVRTSFVRNDGVTAEEEELFVDRWLPKTDSLFVLNMAKFENTNMNLYGDYTPDSMSKQLKYYIEKAGGRWSCLFPFTEMAILPDGKIYYCIESLFRLGFDRDNESLGDYNRQSLAQIWSGDLFRALRTDLILNKLGKRKACQNCLMWKSQVIDRKVTNNAQVFSTTVTDIHVKK